MILDLHVNAEQTRAREMSRSLLERVLGRPPTKLDVPEWSRLFDICWQSTVGRYTDTSYSITIDWLLLDRAHCGSEFGPAAASRFKNTVLGQASWTNPKQCAIWNRAENRLCKPQRAWFIRALLISDTGQAWKRVWRMKILVKLKITNAPFFHCDMH